ILPSTLNGLPVAVVPPAFVTEIGPSTAALGTVTLRVVPPAPIVNGPATASLNFTDVVPVKVFPFRVTGVPATASFGFGSPMIVGLIFRVVGLVVVPFAFVALTEAVSAASARTNWNVVSVGEPTTTGFTPSFAVRTPLARKFDPFTVTVSPTW